MANTRSIYTRIAIEGDKQYKNALSQINNELKMTQSEMKLAQATFKESANTEEALTARGKALSDEYDVQQRKLDLVQKALENAQKAQQEWATAMQGTSTELSAANQALDGMGTSAQKAGTQYANLARELSNNQESLRTLKAEEDEDGAKKKALEETIATLKKRMEELNKSTNGQAKSAGELIEKQRQLNADLNQESQNYDKATKRVTYYQTQSNNAKTSVANLDREIQKNNRYLDEAKKSSDGCATSINKFGKEVKTSGEEAENGGKSLDTISTSLTNLNSALVSLGITKAIQAIADAFNDCVTAASSFSYTMSTVEAVAGASESQMSSLEEQAKEYASTTIFYAQDIADGYATMGRAGFTAEQMLESMSGVMNLAAASGEDLTSTTQTVVDNLVAFGQSADQASHFADVLSEAAADSDTTVAQLSEAFGYVGTTAGNLGYSIDDVAVALAAMAQSGLTASVAGSALSTTLTRMGSNTNSIKMLDELGVSMYDESGEARDLSDVLGDLRTAFAGLTDEEKQNAAYKIAGMRGMRGLLAIVNQSEEGWNNLTESIANCEGAAEDMSNVQLDNLEGDVYLLKSAMEGLQIEVGEQLSPVLRELAGAGTDILAWFKDFVADNKAAVPIITGLATALGVAGTAFTVASVGAWALNAASDALKASLIPVIGGIGAAAVAIGAIAGVAIASANSVDELRDAYDDVQDTVKENTDSWAESREAIEDNNNTILGNVAELESLMATQEKSAGKTAEIKSIVDNLNESVSGLNLSYDEQSGKLNMSTAALEQYVDAAVDAAMAEEVLDEMIAERKTQAEATKDLEEAQAEYWALEKQINDWENGTARNYVITDKDYQRLWQLQYYINGYNDTISSSKAHYAELEDEYGNLIDSANESTDAVTGSADDMADGVGQATQRTIDELEDLYDGYETAAYEAAESAESQIGSYNKLASMDDYTMESLLSNMKKWGKQQEDYYKNLQTVSERYGQAVAQSFADGTDDSIEAVSVLAGATDKQAQEYLDLVASQKAASDAQQQAWLDTANAAVDAAAAEEEAAEIVSGIDLGLGPVATSSTTDWESVFGTEEAKNAAAGFAGEVAASLSDDGMFQASGQSIVSSFSSGIRANGSTAKYAGKSIGTAAATALYVPSVAEESADNLIDKFIDELYARQSDVEDAMDAVMGGSSSGGGSSGGIEDGNGPVIPGSGVESISGIFSAAMSMMGLSGVAKARQESGTMQAVASALNSLLNGKSEKSGGNTVTMQLADGAGRILATGTTIANDLDKINGLRTRLAQRGLAGV